MYPTSQHRNPEEHYLILDRRHPNLWRLLGISTTRPTSAGTVDRVASESIEQLRQLQVDVANIRRENLEYHAMIARLEENLSKVKSEKQELENRWRRRA